jgi:hypothetical protein
MAAITIVACHLCWIVPDFVPAKRQRVKKADFDLRPLELTSAAARGARMAPKPVAKVKLEAGAPVASAGKGASRAKKASASPGATTQKNIASKRSLRGGEQGDLF